MKYQPRSIRERLTPPTLGENENFLMKRHIKLETLASGDTPILMDALNELSGVTQITLDIKRKLLTLHYDALRLDIDKVLSVLHDKGFCPHQTRWQDIKLGLYRFTEENARDNAHHQSHCCKKTVSPR